MYKNEFVAVLPNGTPYEIVAAKAGHKIVVSKVELVAEASMTVTFNSATEHKMILSARAYRVARAVLETAVNQPFTMTCEGFAGDRAGIVNIWYRYEEVV